MPQVFLSSYIVFIFLKHLQSCLTPAFSSFSLPSLLPSFTHQHLAYVFIFLVHLSNLSVCNNRYDPSLWEGLGKLFFLCQVQSRQLHLSFCFPRSNIYGVVRLFLGKRLEVWLNFSLSKTLFYFLLLFYWFQES